MIFLSLLYNAALIVTLSIMINMILRRWKKTSMLFKVLSGLLYGLITIIGMATPYELSPGIIIDGRTIILGLAGFFGGPISALITVIISTLYRIWLSGQGVMTGILLIVVSACLGVVYHYLRKRHPRFDQIGYLIVFSVIVHPVTLLLLAFTFPSNQYMQIIRQIALPVLTIYPLATLFISIFFLDQDSRLKAETLVIEEREKLNTIINNAPLPIFYKNASGIYENGNMAFAKTTGMPLKKILGSKITDIVDNEESRIHKKYDQKLFNEGGSCIYELRTYPPNQPYHDMIFYKSAKLNAEGKVDGIVGMVLDITERKKAEEEAQAKTEELEVYFTSNLDLLCIADLEGNFRRLNPAWENSLGYSIDELIDKPFLDYVHPEDIKSTQEAVNNLRNDKEVLNFTNRYRAKDGSYRYIEWRSRPVKNFIYAVARDITDRIKAENALRESEARFQKLVESAPDAIYVQTNGTFTYLNRAALKLFKIESTDVLLGKPVLDRLDARFHDVEKRSEQILNDEKQDVATMEQVYLQIDNTPVDVEVSAVPIVYQGRDGMLVFVRDITQRKKMERNLIEREKLAGIGTLAAGIAHEINSPLQVITGISERVQARIRSDKPIDVKELGRTFSTINNNAWRIATIVRSLLDYSHTSSEDSLSTSINSLIQKTLLLVEHQLQSWSNIVVKTDLALNLPPILCNANQITQVLINLINNARDAMPAGGEITIQTISDEQKKQVVLRVIDSGTGIPEEIRSKIFDPFFTTKSVGEGTGLGLSIISGIMRAHGGDIELEESSKKGSIFKLSLPTDHHPPPQLNGSNTGRY